MGGWMGGCRVGIWVCFHIEGGHEGFTGKQGSREVIVCPGDTVHLIGVSVSITLWSCLRGLSPRGRDGEEKTSDGKAGILEEIAVILGVWVKICEKDLHNWRRIDWATVSVPCTAGTSGDGLLPDMEMVSGLY